MSMAMRFAKDTVDTVVKMALAPLAILPDFIENPIKDMVSGAIGKVFGEQEEVATAPSAPAAPASQPRSASTVAAAPAMLPADTPEVANAPTHQRGGRG